MGFKGLSGKIAIVTGAAGGIGNAIVRRLVEEECRVAAVDIVPRVLEQFADLPKDAVLPIQADVSREAECDRYVTRTVERFGSVDLFANNAGILGVRRPIVELSLEEFDSVHAVNVRGVFLGLRAVMRQMIKQGRGGAIVNTSSVGGLRANQGSSAYGSAKRAVLGLSGSAALENGRYGIRVNAICPGPIDTPMLRPALGGFQGDFSEAFKNQAIPRVARPAEVAAFVAYLLSDEASYQTGGIFTVDGGLSI